MDTSVNITFFYCRAVSGKHIKTENIILFLSNYLLNPHDMKNKIKITEMSRYGLEHARSKRRTLSSSTQPDFVNYKIRTGKYAFLILCILILFSCKSDTDNKYYELKTKLFYMRMGYHGLNYTLIDMLDKQTDITQGRKYIHKEDINLTPSELEKLNAGITYVEFTPSEKEIEDANILINKINNIIPLVIKTDSICKHAVLFYMDGEKLTQLNKIVKHPESSYAIMDKDFEEIRKLDKEIRAKLGMSLADFLIQNNKGIENDSVKDSAFFSLIFPSLN